MKTHAPLTSATELPTTTRFHTSGDLSALPAVAITATADKLHPRLMVYKRVGMRGVAKVRTAIDRYARGGMGAITCFLGCQGEEQCTNTLC